MKVTIGEYELYPVMFVEKYEGKGRCYEISDELWKKKERVWKEWWELREIFEEILDKDEEEIINNDNL